MIRTLTQGRSLTFIERNGQRKFRAIELNERLFSTYFDLAEIHLARGELEEADRLFRHVMRASPDASPATRATKPM